MKPDKLVATIIKNYMELPDRNIWLSGEDVLAPTGEDDLWAVVGTRNIKPIGVKGFLDTDTNEDVQQATIMSTIDIDLASKDDSARLRVNELTMALESIPAIQLMEKNQMRVFRTLDAIDLSAVEGAGTLHRYRISVIVSSVEEKRKSTDQIFDKFALEVDNE